MQTGTKIVLAVVVAVPVVYVAAVAGGLAPGLTVKCAYHGVKYCSVLSGFDECNLEVSVDSSTCTPSVDQPELHLCGSHRINWALVTGGYTYPDNGIEFKSSYPGAFVDPNHDATNFSWRLTGKKGDYLYAVNVKDGQNKTCTLDPRIYSE